MGDLSRFANRQQVGSLLELVPCSFETGEGDDHKRHIRHQGPARMRKVLCQAVWSRLGCIASERRGCYRLLTIRSTVSSFSAPVASASTAGKLTYSCSLILRLINWTCVGISSSR